MYEKVIPQDLLKEINAQKAACDKIIHSKDRLIAEFQQELKQKVCDVGIFVTVYAWMDRWIDGWLVG